MLEEAWEAIRWDMPSVWIVIVRELPEEREQRESILSLYHTGWLLRDDSKSTMIRLYSPALTLGFLELIRQVSSAIVVAGNINC